MSPTWQLWGLRRLPWGQQRLSGNHTGTGRRRPSIGRSLSHCPGSARWKRP